MSTEGSPRRTAPGSQNAPRSSLPEGFSPHFAVFGVPVRVGMGFWLISIIGFRQDGQSLGSAILQTIAWTAIVFVSILLHELGHALVARRYGASPVITLHAFGGLTSYSGEGLVMTRFRRILISLAGPFAGFALGLAVFLATRHMTLTDPQLWLRRTVLWVNVGWGIINLLPVLPLDGGNVLAAALGPKRVYATAVISAVCAIAVALIGLKTGLLMVFVLFGFFAVSAISQARAARAGDVDRREGLEEELFKAKAALDRGDLDDAYVLADDVVRRSRTMPVKNGGWTALAWIHVARGEGKLAREAIAHVEPKFAVDPYTLAAVEDAAGDPDRARAILEEARRRGFESQEATKLLVDLLARDGRIEGAVDVAHADAHLLEPEDVRAVEKVALDLNLPHAAARLAARLFELHGLAVDALDEARALVKAGDVQAALGAIAHAVQLGIDRALVRDDPAFAELASDERFRTLVTS
ncbi:MAG: site-2 protease family protein [Polyangiales bacterium]